MRYCFVLATVLALLVPAANAISMSVTGGNVNGEVGATMTYESTLKDNVQQNIKLQPASSSVENYWTFSGPGTTKREVKGAWAGHAESGFSVSGSKAYTIYDYSSSAYPYAITAMTLTSSGATDINCYADGTGAAGDYAYVNTEVYDPNGEAQLNGYSNNAIGGQYFAAASQSIANYAWSPNGFTWNFEYASNHKGDVSYVYDYQYYQAYQTYLPFTDTGLASVAVANDDYSIAQNSLGAYTAYYDYAYAYAKPYSSAETTDIKSKNSAGWNILTQDAYTYDGGILGYTEYALNGFY